MLITIINIMNYSGILQSLSLLYRPIFSANIARDLYSLSRLRDENVTIMRSGLDDVITVNHTEFGEVSDVLVV